MDPGNSPRPGSATNESRGRHVRRFAPKSGLTKQRIETVKSKITKSIIRRRRAHHFEAMTNAERHAMAEEAIRTGKVKVTKCPPMASYL